MDFPNSLQSQWFILLQGLGIVAAFAFSGIALIRDARDRRITNRFEATKHHREIWMLLFSNKELQRILDTEADLENQPVSTQERLFVVFLILNLETNYRAGKAGMFKLPVHAPTDIKAFFSRPIARAVWEKMRPY